MKVLNKTSCITESRCLSSKPRACSLITVSEDCLRAVYLRPDLSPKARIGWRTEKKRKDFLISDVALGLFFSSSSSIITHSPSPYSLDSPSTCLLPKERNREGVKLRVNDASLGNMLVILTRAVCSTSLSLLRGESFT